MGGRSAERAVSLETGSSVLDALRERGFEVVAIDVDTDVCDQIERAAIDVAFIALHGRWGEDGCIQGFLESINIPYTGAGVLASALAMDKVLSKQLLRAAGVPTADWQYPASARSAELGFPLVLKPRAEGSSVGVTIAKDAGQLEATLAAATQPLLAERYIPGRELSVAVVGAGADARCLGSIEIVPQNGGFYDYEAKYESDQTRYVTPPEMPADVLEEMQSAALTTHRLLGCAGATRTDFRWDERSAEPPQLLEVNTLPGLTSHSLLPKIAARVGINYGDLVELIIAEAGLKA